MWEWQGGYHLFWHSGEYPVGGKGRNVFQGTHTCVHHIIIFSLPSGSTCWQKTSMNGEATGWWKWVSPSSEIRVWDRAQGRAQVPPGHRNSYPGDCLLNVSLLNPIPIGAPKEQKICLEVVVKHAQLWKMPKRCCPLFLVTSASRFLVNAKEDEL